MKLRRVLTTSVLLLAVGTIPQLALAAGPVTYTDEVIGREIFATPTLGVFVGVASGDLPGQWSATVEHTLLGTNATITGGRFALATRLAERRATVTGTFSEGTVTQISGVSGCVNQTYGVVGKLENVGVRGGTGTGTFSAVLTHLRAKFFGRCFTYGARVAGTVSLTF